MFSVLIHASKDAPNIIYKPFNLNKLLTKLDIIHLLHLNQIIFSKCQSKLGIFAFIWMTLQCPFFENIFYFNQDKSLFPTHQK